MKKFILAIVALSLISGVADAGIFRRSRCRGCCGKAAVSRVHRGPVAPSPCANGCCGRR